METSELIELSFTLILAFSPFMLIYAALQFSDDIVNIIYRALGIRR